jgi:hypothetical protein
LTNEICYVIIIISISHFKEKDGNLVSRMEEDCLTSLTDDSKLVSWEESLKKEDLANIRIGWESTLKG